MNKRNLSPDDTARLRSLAITDHDFLLFVRSAAHLGYGRMLQIIAHEYYRGATEDSLCPPSGVLVVDTCLGLMSKRKQRDFIGGYTADPLFRKREF
jgi:hypothetical protein